MKMTIFERISFRKMTENKKVQQEKILGNNPRITILGTTIDVLNIKNTIDLVDEYIKEKVPLHLMGVNADKINAIKTNKRLAQIVNSCGIITEDGSSVIFAS